MSRRNVPTTLYLTHDLTRRLAEMCEAHRVPRSQIVRDVLTAGLSAWEDEREAAGIGVRKGSGCWLEPQDCDYESD